ncbi:hypothetical protein N656DRAFT_794573 [Canariomyces notabilis]|uniref:Uncharacterized protein n=1 Tax=Canariomyces notabilis TaxID=2074819 RepID=A0AAN6TKR8_9PEZI|nr:hypothetical protein N656DRAFT_794573 [Canariomyces arenarius]
MIASLSRKQSTSASSSSLGTARRATPLFHPLSPPPVREIEKYEKRLLPLLPFRARRQSLVSAFSKEVNEALATPDGSIFDYNQSECNNSESDQEDSEMAFILDNQAGSLSKGKKLMGDAANVPRRMPDQAGHSAPTLTQRAPRVPGPDHLAALRERRRTMHNHDEKAHRVLGIPANVHLHIARPQTPYPTAVLDHRYEADEPSSVSPLSVSSSPFGQEFRTAVSELGAADAEAEDKGYCSDPSPIHSSPRRIKRISTARSAIPRPLQITKPPKPGRGNEEETSKRASYDYPYHVAQLQIAQHDAKCSPTTSSPDTGISIPIALFDSNKPTPPFGGGTGGKRSSTPSTPRLSRGSSLIAPARAFLRRSGIGMGTATPATPAPTPTSAAFDHRRVQPACPPPIRKPPRSLSASPPNSKTRTKTTTPSPWQPSCASAPASCSALPAGTNARTPPTATAPATAKAKTGMISALAAKTTDLARQLNKSIGLGITTMSMSGDERRRQKLKSRIQVLPDGRQVFSCSPTAVISNDSNVSPPAPGFGKESSNAGQPWKRSPGGSGSGNGSVRANPAPPGPGPGPGSGSVRVRMETGARTTTTRSNLSTPSPSARRGISPRRQGTSRGGSPPLLSGSRVAVAIGGGESSRRGRRGVSAGLREVARAPRRPSPLPRPSSSRLDRDGIVGRSNHHGLGLGMGMGVGMREAGWVKPAM